MLTDVIQALEHSNVLLQAEPGAGKSTGLPLALIENASPQRRIVMLEPRRLAARSVAERLASQLGESVGQRIGLRMRGDSRSSKNTVLEIVTEGVLTRLLQADPELSGIGLVIFDEFHERSLHADLGLALCLEVQNSLREDLRLLFMSATLNSDELADHLNANKCESLKPLVQVNSKGRQYPVTIEWSAGVNHRPSSTIGGVNKRDELPNRIVGVILQALSTNPGDLLVFLPGVMEIERTATLLASAVETFVRQHKPTQDITVHRLHSRIDKAEQQRATAPATKTIRRIILSTSLAETSITIDGVQVVIDSGLERRGRCDFTTGAMLLETVSANQASATQRAGRAGRTASGVCYRLWSEADHVRRPTSWQAEIHRADLSSLLLELKLGGMTDIHELPWLEPPPQAGISKAIDLLNELGVLDGEQLTPIGERVSTLPVDPRLAAMLCWARQRGCVRLACKVASLLDEGNTGRATDFSLMLNQPLSKAVQRRVNQLQQAIGEAAIDNVAIDSSILLTRAYPDWIAKRRPGHENRYALACGAGAFLSEDDSLGQSDWLAVANMGGLGKEARVFSACTLDISELRAHCPDFFTEHRHCDWDAKLERVVAEQQVRIGKVVVESKPIHDISNEDKQQALLSGIHKRGIDCLPWTDDCRQWQARVQWIRTLPEHCTKLPWPDVSDEALASQLDDWLSHYLGGISSFKSLGQLDLYQALNSMLSYQHQQELDRLLPSRYTVPSGSNIKLNYSDKDVVLSVKLQEMFGSKENPSIAKGCIPLKVALLSPAKRPVQITSDLANFWSNSYPAVKKDLAGRYPKHPWPDDPVNAEATARAKPRGK